MVVAIVILLLAGAGITYVLLDPLDSDLPPVTDDTGDFQGGASALIYADFDDAQDLHRLDLDTREDVVATELPQSGNTVASVGSSWVAIQVSEEDEGAPKPIVYLFDPETEEEVHLGVLLQPTFSPDGNRLAALRPVDESLCTDARCGGDKEIVVFDLDDPDGEEALGEPGRFQMRGWAGDHLVVSDEATDGLPVLQSISPDGEVADLTLLPVAMWGASPNGAYVVESGEGGTRFHPFSAGLIAGEGAEIPIPEGTVLGSGAWSPDSERVAAFAIGSDGELQLVTFGPSDPEPQVLTEGGGSSTGDVLWSPDSDALAFTRFNGTELEAVYCVVDDPDSCEVLFSWTRGISLLRLE
jgi:hypothetical protein